jgi:hypothetical protein
MIGPSSISNIGYLLSPLTLKYFPPLVCQPPTFGWSVLPGFINWELLVLVVTSKTEVSDTSTVKFSQSRARNCARIRAYDYA